jgi:N-acetyl-anhydromuramyl-L-alanine amidase AmpD
MRYPGAIWYPSKAQHPQRPATWGLVIHWTVGHKAGDLSALTGGKEDVQFYVTKTGQVYQLLDSGSEAWHAMPTANTYTVGIEHEGSGEPYTPAQFAASVKLAAWICRTYKIPVRHTDPHTNWKGIYGHADLHGIDNNDHTDSVPAGTGWPKYLAAVTAATPVLHRVIARLRAVGGGGAVKTL